MRTDSGGVRRLDRTTGAQDTIGFLYGKLRSPLLHFASSKGAAAKADAAPAQGGGRLPPFSSADQWAVATDGRVAIVSVDPYRVTYYAEDGKPSQSAAIPFAPVKVNSQLKTYWTELPTRPLPTIKFGPGGSAGGTSIPKYEEPDEWPDVLPPLLHDAVQFAPDGNLWIERATAAHAPQTFDIIDRSGKLLSRIVLPANHVWWDSATAPFTSFALTTMISNTSRNTRFRNNASSSHTPNKKPRHVPGLFVFIFHSRSNSTY